MSLASWNGNLTPRLPRYLEALKMEARANNQNCNCPWWLLLENLQLPSRGCVTLEWWEQYWVPAGRWHWTQPLCFIFYSHHCFTYWLLLSIGDSGPIFHFCTAPAEAPFWTCHSTTFTKWAGKAPHSHTQHQLILELHLQHHQNQTKHGSCGSSTADKHQIQPWCAKAFLTSTHPTCGCVRGTARGEKRPKNCCFYLSSISWQRKGSDPNYLPQQRTWCPARPTCVQDACTAHLAWNDLGERPK